MGTETGITREQDCHWKREHKFVQNGIENENCKNTCDKRVGMATFVFMSKLPFIHAIPRLCYKVTLLYKLITGTHEQSVFLNSEM